MYTTRFLSRVIGTFLVWVFAGLILIPSSAEAMSLRIDQPKIRLVIPQEGAKSGKIYVENPSKKEIKVKVYLEDWVFSSTADGSKTFYPPGTTELSCANWITFAPAELSILPYGKQSVSYTVNVPADAEGGHYAVMFFETALGEARGQKGVSVAILGRLGSLFYIEPEGTIRRDARLENLTIVKNAGIDIKLDFNNTGNIDISPEGTFYLMDEKGIITARGKFNKVYTLPKDKAIVSSNITEKNASQVPHGEYDLIITIDLGGIPKVLEAKLKIDPSRKISYSLP